MATLRTAVSSMMQPMMALRSSISKASLTHALTSPAKVAHMFDWKKSSNHILTLHITKQAIECAIATHPTIATRSSNSIHGSSNSNTAFPVTTLPPIPLTRDVARDVTAKPGTTPSFHVPSVTRALQDVIQGHNVCGIVVVYPTNTDNGCNNAACGRALHVLDHLSLSGSNNNGCAKPICLYDPNSHHHHSENVVPDEWGRSPLFSTATTANVVHCAKQPHSEPNSPLLQQTWYNFVHQYWPDVSATAANTSSYGDYESTDFEDDDLTEFISKLNKKNKTDISGSSAASSYRTTTFHMNHSGSGSSSSEHKKNLVYQSAF